MRPGKEIKGLRGGVLRYATQENSKIDRARACPGNSQSGGGKRHFPDGNQLK
jgi:hypothetical protein